MNGELIRIWKETVVAYFKALSYRFLERDWGKGRTLWPGIR